MSEIEKLQEETQRLKNQLKIQTDTLDKYDVLKRECETWKKLYRGKLILLDKIEDDFDICLAARYGAYPYNGSKKI